MASLLKPGALALLCLPGLSLACGPDGCEGINEIDLSAAALSCNLGQLPFLSPVNDTRTNLALLLGDQQQMQLVRRADPDDEAASAEAPKPLAPLNVPFSTTDLLGYSWHYARTEQSAVYAQLAKQLAPLGIDEEVLKQAAQRSDAWLEGRCVSNSLQNANDFMQTVLSDSALADTDRRELISQRLLLVGNCKADPAAPDDIQAAQNPVVSVKEAYQQYLNVAAAFYRGNTPDDDLGSALETLAQSAVPWVAEAATYMSGRVSLVAAQVQAEGEYGDFDISKVSQPKLKAARQAFERYLQRYPDGRYASSATGLFRRIAWMTGSDDALAAQTQSAWSALTPADDAIPLLNEVDGKLLRDEQKTYRAMPVLGLIQDLRWLRAADYSGDPVQLQADDISRQLQQQQLSATDADYLTLAQAYYVAKDYTRVVASVPPLPAAGPLTLRDFSAQMLKGMALMAQQQWPVAKAHWQQMKSLNQDALRDQLLQIAQAMTLERSQAVAEVFQPDSWIVQPQARDLLIRFVAADDTLLALAKGQALSESEQRTALFTLLYKDLTRGRYADFVEDARLVDLSASLQQWQRYQQWQANYDPSVDTSDFALGSTSQYPGIFAWQGQAVEGAYPCDSLQQTAERLAADSNDPHSLNCLGEFYLRNGFDQAPLGIRPSPASLAGTEDRFGGKAMSRLALYRQVMDYPRASASDRSYALYRAIRCFAPSGYNSCSADDIPLKQRKQWFNTLKREYGSTPWAQSLKYYW